jgi:hypothetical protein
MLERIISQGNQSRPMRKKVPTSQKNDLGIASQENYSKI